MCWYIFYTPRGWAAILGDKKTISTTVLPTPSPLNLFLNQLDKTGHKARFIANDDNLFPVINKFRDYYRNIIITDWDVELDLQKFPAFTRQVLQYVYTIPYGQTMTYSEVAEAVGNRQAARAVGQAMRINPIPLIIPCHRVLAKNGWGGFSSPGGIDTKIEMLNRESLNLAKLSAQ